MIPLERESPRDAAAWHAIVSRIRAGDSAACEELYSTAFQDIRRWFLRVGDPHADDRTHDTYLATILAIMKGDPRDPGRLPGFIRVMAHRQFCSSLRRRQKSRAREVAAEEYALSDPNADLDSAILVRQKQGWVQSALRHLPARQRDILERFYVLDQDPRQICAEMRLSENQFRLLKWRAKSRFVAIAQRRMSGDALVRLARQAASNG